MIALENLFLKDANQELSYKMSMRMAHLLAETNEEREKIFEFVKNAYSLRSKIVHGGKTNLLSEKHLLDARKLLRKSIKYFLNNKELWKGSQLDTIIIQGSFFPNHILQK